MFDVIIAGGGIAGMSAALILGRCRRNILICDTGKPRNSSSKALHGFISRDGINPFELRHIIQEELKAYPSVIQMEAEIIDAEAHEKSYEVRLIDGRTYQGKYLLVATGIVDHLPDIDGIERYYGHNVFHCPYCDGWELRDQALAVYAEGATGVEYALELTGWSNDVILCTDGKTSPSQDQLILLEHHGIKVVTQRIRNLEGEIGGMFQIRFQDDTLLTRRALFFYPSQSQASPLAGKLGCTITPVGEVETGKFQQTRSRLFVAGDAAKSIQLAIIAAAEGAEAAFALNTALHKEDLENHKKQAL
ncbi:NAD(P)/FAD-dependent oxidoreductase [Pelotalea chapellei]|uniref:NAD(P)/FAD-dependent oxidoreductase n=1 Tax=Pelotalea chapellei TaxID=44671 RepID=A0ABS5U6W0_9BACT|nr:NAD(P)/FAD-dependent oxidoreductase [Pelotalea chapellei]MBT1071403.1 NAD(P)/FAD-dependent oxidoreductase [Pelotalea chapellei]